jgi:CRP-like cAMP-binding protein
MTEINIFKSSPDAVEVKPGDVLFREGESGDAMFAVVEGEVELTRGTRVIDAIGPGGIAGEMALVDTGPRSATATVKVGGRIVRVDQRHFVFLVHEHPTFALTVMKIMAERLRRANTSADE